MSMKFKTTTTLNAYKVGNELVFTDRRVLSTCAVKLRPSGRRYKAQTA